MGYILYFANLGELTTTFQNVKPFYILLLYSTTIPLTLISTLKWMLLLKPQGIHETRFIRLWALYHVGMFFSNFLPSEVGGDAVRCYEVGKESGKHAESLVAVITERITGLYALIIYGLIGLMLNWNLAKYQNLNYLILLSFLTFIVAPMILLDKRIYAYLESIRFSKVLSTIIVKCGLVRHAFYKYKRSAKAMSQVVLISFLYQLYVIWYTYALARCLSLEVYPTMIQLMLIMPAITIISLIPISINALGLREGAFVILFSLTGLSTEQSLVLALLTRLGVLAPSLVGGFIYIGSDLKLMLSKIKEA